MAICGTESDSQLLSGTALRLYEAYAREDHEEVAALLAEYPDARSELQDLALITVDPEHPDTPVLRDPKQAMQRKLAEELAEAEARVARMKALPALSESLNRHYQMMQRRAGGSEYLADPAAVNARIRDVVGAARTRILAAQPGGPRSKELIDLAVSRDAAALDRGVVMRTIYRETVRDDVLTAEFARTMSSRGAGRSAQYRTLPGKFERMIIVDGGHAFVSNHIVEGSPNSAWHVTDRAVVAVLAAMFESKWLLAQPWAGELRPRQGGDSVDTVSGSDGLRTTPRQRQILRYLAGGLSQESIARRIGISKRTLEKQITAMKDLWGARTLSELIYLWAMSPDNIDDNSTVTDSCKGREN